MTLLYIILGTLLIACGALIGIFTVGINERRIHNNLLYLVALSSGTMLGGAFIHLLPEAANILSIESIAIVMMFTVIIYLLIEKILHWRHCHDGENCTIHTFGTLNLIGDGIHNFIDGIVIAAAFVTDYRIGLTTLIAMAAHEIPQEIGDFGVLLHAGFNKRKALLWNFVIALTAVVGGIVGWLTISSYGDITPYLLPIAAGGFIYIAVSDLLPELRQQEDLKTFFGHFFCLLIGVGIMFAAKLLGGE